MVNLASAVVVKNVQVDTFAPGQEGLVRIEIENVLNDNAEDVSVLLKFDNLPFIPVGSSEQTVDEIKDGDEESYVFRIKTSNDVIPGDYEIPYEINYVVDDVEKKKGGTIGVRVSANPDLVFSVGTENPIMNQQGQVTLKIVNKGFFEARFVSVKVLPEDFTLLSDSEEYIGTVDSDDFETAAFDVIFKKTNPTFRAIVEYTDFDNKKVIENVELSFVVYTPEKALELGLTQKNNFGLFAGVIVTLIIFWILWRTIKKSRRMKKSMEMRREK